MSTGTQLRDQGITDTLAADTAVHRDYQSLVQEALAHMGDQPFTSDDIHDYIEHVYPDAAPHHYNVVGGAIRTASLRGQITYVGSAKSDRPSRRKGPITEWVITP